MAETLAILGCGNLGRALLQSLVAAAEKDAEALPFRRFIATVRSTVSAARLREQFAHAEAVTVYEGGRNVEAAAAADVVILGVDPADVAATLQQAGLAAALEGKLLISVAAGWSQAKLGAVIAGVAQKIWVLRTLPNIAALASASLTAIEVPNDPEFPPALLQRAEAIFACCGRTLQIPPRLMSATTAVAGSTPAFFAVIVDALVDAAVAVGVPRAEAQAMVYQSMAGTAALLQGGMQPGVLRDQGTSPEGCTIAGVMVLEERGVRGAVGRALRESVTVARQMGEVAHPNDTH